MLVVHHTIISKPTCGQAWRSLFPQPRAAQQYLLQETYTMSRVGENIGGLTATDGDDLDTNEPTLGEQKEEGIHLNKTGELRSMGAGKSLRGRMVSSARDRCSHRGCVLYPRDSRPL